MADGNSNETFSSHTCPPPLKKKNKMQIPCSHFFSRLSEGIWEVLTALKQTRQHHIGGFWLVVLCDRMMWEDSSCSLARDTRTGSPCSATHALSTKKNNNTKTKICNCKARTLQKLTTNPHVPRGEEGLGWELCGVAVHQPAAFISGSSQPLIEDGLSFRLSLHPVGVWQ